MNKFVTAAAALMFSWAAVAGSVADSHTDMAGCDACHDDGMPSSDLVYENETCVGCHGDLADLTQVHQDHQGMMVCTDCHITHEEGDDASSTCANCH
ncbi:cytochrome c3 family protein [Ferrimonas pelagia]|uniref:Tetrahaem cytochrome domain-containing protein n=1 Tax=Ferrimonas pelagia TaxID=1177826 RepID=A0ABP9FCX4_9GAMM